MTLVTLTLIYFLIILLLLIIIFYLLKTRAIYKSESLTDHLTQLPNKRHFDEELEQTFHLSQRYNHNLTLLTLDLDLFKNYNDHFGHPAGDRLLRKFAAILKKTMRESDFASRTGGEEFAVILPETDNQKALILAERIRQTALTQANGVTVSIGLASFPKDTKNKEELIEKSDQALYQAKRTRNSIICYQAG